MLCYFFRSMTGEFTGAPLTTDEVAARFSNMTNSAGTLTLWMVIAALLAFGICALGVQNGVEKITKVMMLCLLVLIVVLAVHSITLPEDS